MKRRSFLTRAALSVAAFLFPSVKAKLQAQHVDGGTMGSLHFVDADKYDYRRSRPLPYSNQAEPGDPDGGCCIGFTFGPHRFVDDIHSNVRSHFAGLHIQSNATPEDVAVGLELLAAQLRSGKLLAGDKLWLTNEIRDYSPKRTAPEPKTDKWYPSKPVTEESALAAMRKVGLA